MAQKTHVTMVDDVTGEEIKEGDDKTISVGWDGRLYQLDVSGDTYAAMKEYFDDVLQNARVVRGRTTHSDPAAPQKRAHAERVSRIRAWAREQGMEIADRGRLQKDVVEAYEEAHPEDTAA